MFIGLVLAGLVVQVISLPLPGTEDVRAFKIWTYGAAIFGPAQVYGTGGWPPFGRPLVFNGDTAHVDYPPLALDELALVGHGYRALFPTFPDDARLTIAVKLLPLIAGGALTALILVAATRIEGMAAGRRAALAYWANPAAILHGSVLGYVGAICALPAVGALVAATRGLGWLAGGLLAGACWTKPQGLLAMPAVALALFQRRGSCGRPMASAILGVALVTSACLWPIIHARAFLNMSWAVLHLIGDETLSAQSANLWWVVTYATQVAHTSPYTSLSSALMQPLEYVSIRTFLTSIGADSSPWSIAALVASSYSVALMVIGWAIWQARSVTDLPGLAALAAFTVHAYVVLSVQVHENHLFHALPLLAIATTTRPRYWLVLVTVSVIAALNLNLFYGLGDNVGYAIPRKATGIDATVILAILNCGALVWHALTFRDECRALQPGSRSDERASKRRMSDSRDSYS